MLQRSSYFLKKTEKQTCFTNSGNQTDMTSVLPSWDLWPEKLSRSFYRLMVGSSYHSCQWYTLFSLFHFSEFLLFPPDFVGTVFHVGAGWGPQGSKCWDRVRNAKGLLRYNTCDRKQLQDWAGLGGGYQRTLYTPDKVCTSLAGNSQAKIAREKSSCWAEMARPLYHHLA